MCRLFCFIFKGLLIKGTFKIKLGAVAVKLWGSYSPLFPPHDSSAGGGQRTSGMWGGTPTADGGAAWGEGVGVAGHTSPGRCQLLASAPNGNISVCPGCRPSRWPSRGGHACFTPQGKSSPGHAGLSDSGRRFLFRRNRSAGVSAGEKNSGRTWPGIATKQFSWPARAVAAEWQPWGGGAVAGRQTLLRAPGPS